MRSNEMLSKKAVHIEAIIAYLKVLYDTCLEILKEPPEVLGIKANNTT
jgi:hypothetical protein